MAEPTSPLLRTFLAVDRSRWAAAVACAVALAIGFTRLPPTADALLARAIEMQTPQGGGASHIYGTLQGRPSELCSAFAARQPPVLAAIAAQLEGIKASTQFEPARIVQVMDAFTREVHALFWSPPEDPSCWTHDANYAYFQAGYPIDAPFIWITRRLGLSTIHVALALTMGSWLGLICLVLAARRLSGSAACGILSVMVLHYAWSEWSLTEGNYLFVFNAFVPLYAGQLLASSRPIADLRNQIVRWGVEALLVLAVAFHSLLQIFVYPFNHRLNGTVVLLVVGLIGLLLRDRRILLRTLVLAVALNLVLQPYYRDSKADHAQLTNFNLAAGQGFTNVMLAMGMFERPTFLGLPNGDFAFTWIHWLDPYLKSVAPHLVVHQSLDTGGRELFAETLRHTPLTFAEALWKRLLVQTVFHRELNIGWYFQNDAAAWWRGAVFSASLVLFAAVCLWTLAFPAAWPLVWPPVALIGWQLFGVNTLLTMVHLHTVYSFTGLVMLLALTPPLVVGAWRSRRGEMARPLRAVAARIGNLRNAPRMMLAAILVVSLLLAGGANYGAREIRKEALAFRLWVAIHFAAGYGPIGDSAWRSPAQLAEMIQSLRALGHEPPGAVEIHAAWIFWVYNYQNVLYKRGPATNDPALQAAYKAQADGYILSFYREALRQAPDNPHFGSYALMINDPEWPAIFRRTLAAAPTHHHAAYMAYNLIGQEGDPGKRAEIIGIFERETARQLAATAGNRPGYIRLPAVTGASSATGPEGVVVQLSDGTPATLPAIELRGAPALRVGLYVEARQGAVRVSGVPGGKGVAGRAQCTTFDIDPAAQSHYRTIDCDGLEGVDAIELVVSSASAGASALVRDYYPMFSIVRLPQ